MNEMKLIKNKYGEQMWHYCKQKFPTILEREGLLYKILTENFAPSKLLYNSLLLNKKLDEFNIYIHSLFYRNINFKITNKTVKELMDEAGYDIYECKNDGDMEKFKKYYRPDELICTFRGGRTNSHHVFFAIKKNVESIKRELIPTRDGDYGTSVISIQFEKGNNNILSIKNRYNTNVKNADNTFDNNLENIIPGLTKSFEREYNLNICDNYVSDFNIINFVKDKEKKFYQYNMCINNICYCPHNNIVDNNRFIKDYKETEKYILMDYFILDLENKVIKTYDESIHDSFIDGLQNIVKIVVEKNDKTLDKVITLTLENKKSATIVIDKANQIIGYYNSYLEQIGDDFLKYNLVLRELYLPNVKKIGHNCLFWNYEMEKLELQSVFECGDYFLPNNCFIDTVIMHNLKKVGTFFIRSKCTSLKKVDLDNLEFLPYGSFGNCLTIEQVKNPQSIDDEDYAVKKSKIYLRKIN